MTRFSPARTSDRILYLALVTGVLVFLAGIVLWGSVQAPIHEYVWIDVPLPPTVAALSIAIFVATVIIYLLVRN